MDRRDWPEKNKTHHWKKQTKISKWTNCQSHTPKYRKAPSRFCMADELNGQALPVHHTNPYKNYNFQNDGTSW